MTNAELDRNARFRGVGIALLALGGLGLLAAFELTVEKFRLLANPEYRPACDISVLVSCNVNLASWQGSLFGFPNPIIGVVAWSVIITTGVLLVARVSLPRFYWWGLAVGHIFAVSFVVFLIYTSIFSLGKLCPWCMLTWSVTIPSAWLSLWAGAKAGAYGPGLVRLGTRMLGVTALVSTLCYAAIAIVAQVQIDALVRIVADLTRH